MPFITEIPSEKDIHEYNLSPLLAHPHNTWTVDKNSDTFLILQRECQDPLYNTHEDFYFGHQDELNVVSFGLRLTNDGDCLIFHWLLISTYGGLSRLTGGNHSVLLKVNEKGRISGDVLIPKSDSADMLESLKAAFIAYKTDHGFEENSHQRMIVDCHAAICDADTGIVIAPVGSVHR